jgi:hypothetical protein
MANLGKKYSCYSCHTKFYDLGKPIPTCPKCGADQRDSEEAPVVTSTRGRRIVDVPLDDEFEADDEVAPAVAPAGEEEEAEPYADEPEPEAEEEEDY